MSFVVTTGVYTPPAGAESAAAGQVLQSAVWNNIWTDISNNGLTVLGKGQFPQQVPLPSVVQLYAAPVAQAISFGVTIQDVATFAINLPTSVSFYTVESIKIYGANGSLQTSVPNSPGVALYTAAAGGGIQVVGSTSLTVTSSVASSVNPSLQTISASVSTILTSGTLTLRVVVSATITTNANALLSIRPLF